MNAHNEETKGTVVGGPGISDEFRVNVGLMQGSARRPQLFIAVVEVFSKKTSKRNIICKLLYADNLAVSKASKARQERCIAHA